MTPQQFLGLYPQTSRRELAAITGSSEPLVNHWFCEGVSRKAPTKRVLLILRLIHALREREAELQRYKEYVHGR